MKLKRSFATLAAGLAILTVMVINSPGVEAEYQHLYNSDYCLAGCIHDIRIRFSEDYEMDELKYPRMTVDLSEGANNFTETGVMLLVTHWKYVYDDVYGNCTGIYPENSTFSGTSYNYSCVVNQTRRRFYWDQWEDVDWTTFKMKKNRWYYLRIWGNREPKLGSNDAKVAFWIGKSQVFGSPDWKSGWESCRDLTIIGNITGRVNEPVTKNLTGLTFDNATSEVIIVNTSCNNGGSEVEQKMHQNGTDSVYTTFIVDYVPASANATYSVYYDNSDATEHYDMVDFYDTGNLSYNGTGYPNITGSEWIEVGVADYNQRLITADGINMGHPKLHIETVHIGNFGEDYWTVYGDGGTTAKTTATMCAVYRVVGQGTDNAIHQNCIRSEGWGTGTEKYFVIGLNTTALREGYNGGITGTELAPASNTRYHEICLAGASTTSAEVYLDGVYVGNTSSGELNDYFRSMYGDISSSGNGGTDSYWSWWVFNSTDYLPPLGVSIGAEEGEAPEDILVNLVSPANNTNTTDDTPDFTWNHTGGFSQASCTVRASNASGEVHDIYNNATTQNATDTTGTSNITLKDGTWTWWVYGINGSANNVSLNYTLRIDTTPPLSAITYPENISYTENISALNYNVIETYPDSCWYSTDGGATNSSPVSSGTNFTGITSVGNNNTWTVYCNDTLGNENSTSETFDVQELWYTSSYPFANRSFRITEFINVSGTNFTLAGEEYRLLGTDSYYLADYATNHTYDDDGNEINNSRAAVTEILNEAKYLGFNVLRTWAGMQGGNGTAGYSSWPREPIGGHWNLFEVNEPGNYSEEMFAALDWVIQEASERDIRLQLVLVNNWNDYGGMRWYAQKSPTTDKTYENLSDDSDINYWGFHDQFYNDSWCMFYFQNYTNYILNRNNTLTGILYKDDPTIFSWLLVNEPRAKSDGRGRDLIKNWTINMTAFIKSIDSNHLVGLGIEGWGYNETWGEGTDFISDHNNTGVDFATYALHPDQWAYFGERSEHSGDLDWVDEGTGSDAYIDWWTNDTGLSYNNRYEGSYVPAYTPALARHGYDDWVRQNVEWADDLGMPVLLQEAGYLTDHNKTSKDRFYEQMIHNFYDSGGDGLMFWTLNHDDYYYSTDTDGDMDDGYGFYVSSDAFLKNKSESVMDAIDFTKTDNSGDSWVKELNDYKYDFVVNLGLASDKEIANCTLWLNVYNGTWTGNYTDQTNSSSITEGSDYTFTTQFNSTDQELYWFTECCSAPSLCINSTPAHAQLNTSVPTIALSSPADDEIVDSDTPDFNYTVTNTLEIVNCDLYINGTFNRTDTTVTRDIVQTISQTFSPGDYNWSVECTDVDDNVGNSTTRDFTVDTCNCPATGNWNMNGTDNCTITSDCDMKGNNFILKNGPGKVVLAAKIYNFTLAHLEGCVVHCNQSGGCFKM